MTTFSIDWKYPWLCRSNRSVGFYIQHPSEKQKPIQRQKYAFCFCILTISLVHMLNLF